MVPAMYLLWSDLEKYLSTGRTKLAPASCAGQITSPANMSGVLLLACSARCRFLKYVPVSAACVSRTTLILPFSLLFKLAIIVGTVPVVSGPFQNLRVTGPAAPARCCAAVTVPAHSSPT